MEDFIRGCNFATNHFPILFYAAVCLFLFFYIFISSDGADYEGRTGLGTFIYGSPMSYDANGNLTVDEPRNILRIRYNRQNQPTEVTFGEGHRQAITYDGFGRKIRVDYSQVPDAMIVGHQSIYADDWYQLTSTREYVGPHVFCDGRLEYSALPGGYFDPDKGAMYYITDWQGNNAAVVDKNGTVAQQTIYYPYGEPTIEPEGQRYLYGGKEREHAGGRNAYDFGARCLTPYGRWGVPDSEAKSFYPYSPYCFCNGDPINHIDPDGKQVLVMPSPILGVSNPLLLSSSKPIVRPVAEAVTNEGHHIIPRALKTRPIVEEAIKQGYKFEGKENLTSVEKFSKAANTGRHGNHPKYTERVAKKIESSNPGEGSSAIDIIRGIATEALKAIQDNPGIKINDLEFETMMPSLDLLKLFLERFQDGGSNEYAPWIQNNDSENEVPDSQKLYLIYCR